MHATAYRVAKTTYGRRAGIDAAMLAKTMLHSQAVADDFYDVGQMRSNTATSGINTYSFILNILNIYFFKDYYKFILSQGSSSTASILHIYIIKFL